LPVVLPPLVFFAPEPVAGAPGALVAGAFFFFGLGVDDGSFGAGASLSFGGGGGFFAAGAVGLGTTATFGSGFGFLTFFLIAAAFVLGTMI